MDTHTKVAPSHWAGYLINGDSSSFSYYDDPEDEELCYAFEQANGHCVGVQEIGFTLWFDMDVDTLSGDASIYTFIANNA